MSVFKMHAPAIGQKRDQVDMLHGPIVPALFRFALPVIFMGILQLLFQTVDLVMAGNIVGPNALAAIGATSSFQYIFTNLYIGLGTAVNVVVARAYGAGNEKNIRHTIHTALPFSVLLALCGMGLGILSAPTVLRWLDTPVEVYADAVLYVRVCFLGAVPISLYQSCAGIMRAYGDTKRPFCFLLLSGVLNVALNAFFMAGLRLGVVGAAIGTVLSQVVSALCLLFILLRRQDVFRVSFFKMRLRKKYVLRLTAIGLPVAVQNICYSFCNLLIQGGINIFGNLAMAGSTAAGSVGDYVWTMLTAWSQTVVTFVGQNAGANQYSRTKKILKYCLLYAGLITLFVSVLFVAFARPLSSLFTSNATAQSHAVSVLRVIVPLYIVYGTALILAGFLQGLGHSFLPMLANIVGICGVRLFWLYIVFEQQSEKTLQFLYYSYPLSWSATLLLMIGCAVICWRPFKRQNDG